MERTRIILLFLLQATLCDVTNTKEKACGANPKCAMWEFECACGDCINMRHYCDGINDCPDKSDEIIVKGRDGCSNILNNANMTCKLPSKYVCDSIDHCDDKMDENSAICKIEDRYQMRCDEFGHCINKFFLNCSERADWSCSDKILCKGDICSRRAEGNEIVDQSHECESLPIFSCNSGECLSAEKFCDGIIDCEDGSDEIIADFTNLNGGISCSNKWNSDTKRCVLPAHHVCDKIDHCDDRIDECQPGCESSFICNNGKCIHRTLPFICNGKDECGDSSDECFAGCDQRGHNVFTCNDGTCIAIELYCDGRVDCPDSSDEISKSVNNNTDVVCGNRHNPSTLECVLPRHHVCDDVIHCVTGEDELHCNISRWYKCQNNHLVDSTMQVCNFKDECCDSSDECAAPDCNKTFTCPNNGKCIAFGRFCDGVDDCGDGSDEIMMNITGLLCNNQHNDVERACVLPPGYICDGLNHCKNREDECAPGCPSSFICGNGKCLSRHKLCDGIADCEDNSDEMTRVPGFKCAVKHHMDDVTRSCVMPQYLLFDSTHDCRDQSDACSVSGICFKCLTESFFISSQQVCDGIIDCPDFSDECTCSTQSGTIEIVCANYCLLEDAGTCSNCDVGSIACDNGTNCIEKKNVCDGTMHCMDGSDENVCVRRHERRPADHELSEAKFECISSSKSERKLATECDGVLECLYFDDECSIKKEVSQSNRNRTNSRDRREKETQFVCGEKTSKICKKLYDPVTRWFHCPGRPHQFFLADNICDGIEDCARESGEKVSVDEQDCSERVRCERSRPKEKKKITIHRSRLCDLRIDCEDEEDEDEEICNERGRGQSRFYCENRSSPDSTKTKLGPLFVSKQEVLDGKNDCWDGSDECPTQLFHENTFSSRHRMIRNVILSGIVWLMGVLALLGNFVVMWHSVTKLRSTRRFSPMMKSNYILVFNLAAADFLMGVYLLALAIQNARTDGSYCRVDLQWRSGSTCAALGSLALVSIQSSVFFLVLLTTYRVVAVLRPFRADSLRVRYTVTLVILAWFLALILAVAPRLPQFIDYFVSAVWVSPGVYFFDTNTPTKQEIGKFAQILMSHANGTQSSTDISWNKISSAISNIYPKEWPELRILGEFGYYSAHSVCLPKFFVKVDDSAWAYSVAIMTFDLASFIYIATSYRVIYYDAARSGALRNDYADENKTMQARITRLVLADFLCLVPVCMTAFLSVVGVEINPVAYAIAAIVLLPINSALNPILYSNVLSVLYSSCITPVTAFVTKRIMRKQKPRSIPRPDQRCIPPGRNVSNYRLCRASTVTSNASNDEMMNIERMRLGSDESSATNHFNVSMDTTNTKI